MMKNNQNRVLSFSIAIILAFNITLAHSLKNTLTMQEAVELALQHRPNIQALEHILSAKQYDEKLAWSGYFPSVTLNTRTEQFREGSTLPSVSHTSTSLHAQQLVYDPAGPQALARIAKKQTEALQFEQDQIKNAARFAVELVYLDCWQLQQQYASIHSLNKATHELWKRSQHQHNVDLTNKHEWLSAIEAHSNNLATVRHYYDNLASVAKQLMFLTGNSKTIDLLPREEDLPTRLAWPKQAIQLRPLRFYQKLAQQHRPELHVAQKRIEETNEAYHLASNTRLPKLFVSGNTAHHSGLGAGRRSSHQIGATLQWNVFDQAKSDMQAAQAHAQKLAAQLNKQEVINQINIDVEQAYYALSQDLTRLKATHFKYMRAKNELFLRTQEHAAETLSTVDYQQAKAAWEQVSFEWIAQKTTSAKKYRELLYKCGYPTKMVL